MAKSNIEWTDATWNPTTGCDKVSRGCKHCYAEIMHKRLRAMGQAKYRQPFLGHVEIHPEELHRKFPKSPRMIFVDSMSDLFHKDVPEDFIAKVFATMARWPQHIFQILTKRPDRMAEIVNGLESQVQQIVAHHVKKGHWADVTVDGEHVPWPLPNVWLGTSIEEQKQDHRLTSLCEVDAEVRFLSCEPLLGPLELHLTGTLPETMYEGYAMVYDKIHWVIAGGESGPEADPVHPNWIRSLRDQCVGVDIPFYFKQWGAYLSFEETAHPPFWQRVDTGERFDSHMMNFYDPMTNEPGKWCGYQWLDPLYSVEMDEDGIATNYLKVGKKKAGNTIDGQKWEQFPEITTQIVQ